MSHLTPSARSIGSSPKARSILGIGSADGRVRNTCLEFDAYLVSRKPPLCKSSMSRVASLIADGTESHDDSKSST